MLEYDSPISQKPGGRVLSLIQRRFCANSINLLVGGKQRPRVPAEPPPKKSSPAAAWPPPPTKADPPPFPSSAAFLPVMWEGAGVEAFCRSRGFTGAGGHAREKARQLGEKKNSANLASNFQLAGSKARTLAEAMALRTSPNGMIFCQNSIFAICIFLGQYFLFQQRMYI